jgi:hypothetical protein
MRTPSSPANFRSECRRLWALAIILLAVAGVAHAQAQSDAPRKADAQAVRNYERAKEIDARIAAKSKRAAEKLERSVRADRVSEEGLIDEVQGAMRRACSDVPQGCRYDEALAAFIPLPAPPKVQPPAASSAPAPSTPEPEKK